MTDLMFPEGFLWGTATAAHQVEGDNTNTDWWEWELHSGRCRESSGSACEHYTRYPQDVALLAGLGFNMYRYSVEWARIEPSEGAFDQAQIDHYVAMTDTVRAAGLVPMVTLNHFTLPLWVAREGGWTGRRTPALFERFARKVAEALGDRVPWYCTINEPGMVALGGYMGGFSFPPGTGTVQARQKATARLIDAHHRAFRAIKELQPAARVGQTHAMAEWEAHGGGRPAMEYARRTAEDVFLEASAGDDFVGVQTYTRNLVVMPAALGPIVRLAVTPPFDRAFVKWAMHRSRASGLPSGTDDLRRTQMGWEFRPQAVVASVRRAAELLPGKDIVVTENGVSTADDAERIEYVGGALAGLHGLIGEGLPLRGYTYWSAFDNFEWAQGYSMLFGLIGVDRETQERTVKPSARWLGEIARTNRLSLPNA